jgi:hypothetical protein
LKEVEAYAEEKGPGPRLNPMRLSFLSKPKHPWNQDLAEQFIEQLKKELTIHPGEEQVIYSIFFDNFSNLRCQFKKWIPKTGESQEEVAVQVRAKKLNKLQKTRRDTRQNGVSKLFAPESNIILNSINSYFIFELKLQMETAQKLTVR